MSSIVEADFVESLRARYEAEGYTFVPAPDPSDLPSFLNGYRPDAIAQRSDRSILIQVKAPQAQMHDLQDVQRRLDGHPDWTLNVVAGGRRPERIELAPATPNAIRDRLDDIRALAKDRHHRAAFVMLWPLMEAIARGVDDPAVGPLAPGTIVQSFVMNGMLDPKSEHQVRDLIALRHRIVHGDVHAEPTKADVDLLLKVVDGALSADVA